MHADTVADGRSLSCGGADPVWVSLTPKDLLDVQAVAQDASVVFLDVRNAGEHGSAMGFKCVFHCREGQASYVDR